MGQREMGRLDPGSTREHFDEIQPGYDPEDHRQRTLRQAASAGFEAVAARENGVLVGFAYGLPISARSTRWDGLRPVALRGQPEKILNSTDVPVST
ncbi:hypothetical protein FHS44_006156 [Streptosporangium saharense]|uniref:Uncharacterized protein n=1 Tax=Streptosporangium saharense TaxID=1706840 RepID=A0A7W7VR61_9ACTN|nr:hypothetical protein [Streptosporangium saharense]